MHELSIALSILDVVEEEAQHTARRGCGSLFELGPLSAW